MERFTQNTLAFLRKLREGLRWWVGKVRGANSMGMGCAFFGLIVCVFAITIPLLVGDTFAFMLSSPIETTYPLLVKSEGLDFVIERVDSLNAIAHGLTLNGNTENSPYNSLGQEP